MRKKPRRSTGEKRRKSVSRPPTARHGGLATAKRSSVQIGAAVITILVLWVMWRQMSRTPTSTSLLSLESTAESTNLRGFESLESVNTLARKIPANVRSVEEVQALARGQDGWNCEQVIRAYIKRLGGRRAKEYKAVVEVRDIDAILREASSRNPSTELYCVPVIVKDNIDVEGMISAAGSIAMEKLAKPATAHAPSIARLVDAGAVVLGHANMDEFALGFRTSSSRGGQTLNAFDKTRYPGGSSGGTAVAVAQGLAVLGVGTDTGGSVRIPASFAGLYGIRPSISAVPVGGVVPLSHSRDTVGFMASRAEDVALAYSIASGSSQCSELLSGESSKTVRLGVLPMLLPIEDNIRQTFLQAVKDTNEVKFVMIDDGPALEEVSKLVIQLTKQKSTSYFEFQEDLRKFSGLSLASLASSTAESCSERLDAAECDSVVATIRKKIHGKLTKREVESYELLTQTFPAVFELALSSLLHSLNLDAFAYPTFKKLPSRISSGKQQYCANNRLAPALGWPAITVPLGKYQKLPQGVEVMAPRGQECLLFGIAKNLGGTAVVN
mmetsp:Transcript_17187/g.33698  ORF Transcript_17187/g.33698 Transcript_17187/m.33698 type:complete len:555 (+) Transcript_17187:36-1700(+)